MVPSKFNTKNVCSTLCLIACGVLTMCGVSKFNKEEVVSALLVWGAFTLLFSLAYLASLKRITVLADGVEVQSYLLPFWKRFYRFAEFDYAQSDYRRTGEVLRLIKDGKRLVSIDSHLYSNYNELKEAVSVKNKRNFAIREKAEVVSEYAKLYLYGITVLFLFFILTGMGTCFIDVMNGKPIRQSIVLLGVIEILFFGSFLFIHLSQYKKIAVWRGQIEVKPLLWPFKVRYYNLSDFDGFYYVLEESNSQLGSSDENSLWLMKDRKLAISVSEIMYKNYEQLKNALQTVNCLGQLKFSGFQALKYYLGKKI